MKANRQGRILAVLSAAAILMVIKVAYANPVLEGTWLLSKPQTLLLPADGSAIPFTEAGRKLYEQNRSAAQGGDFTFDGTMTRCSSPGIPRLMLSTMPFRVFERPGK